MKSPNNFKYSPDGLVVVEVAKGDVLDDKGIAAAKRLGLIKEQDKGKK